jgi:hypothetical protein
MRFFRPVSPFLVCLTLALTSIAQPVATAPTAAVRFDPVHAPDFTLIALPDPQMYSEFSPQIWMKQTEWIAAHAAELNLKLVIGLGDMVNDGDSEKQYRNADAAVRVLDRAGVPYIMAVGNHDYLHIHPATRQVPTFEKYFGLKRYKGRPYIGRTTYPAGSMRNFYAEVPIGDARYLFLVLEYFPPKEALDWAKGVLDQHLSDRVIVVTHAFEGSDGFRTDACDFNGPSAENVDVALTAEDMWQQLLSRYTNIMMVLNGHVNGAAREIDRGTNGNMVNHILADYQDEVEGGGGFIRILTFRAASHKMEVRTYSPWHDEFKADDSNQFTVPLDATALDVRRSGLRGHIRGLDCEDLPGAKVTYALSGAQPATVTAGAAGYFATPANLVPGVYAVTVTADGYQPARTSVEVHPGYIAAVRPLLVKSTGSRAQTDTAETQGIMTTRATYVIAGICVTAALFLFVGWRRRKSR